MLNYTLMWAEEDHNYFDLEPALLNFGIKAEKKFGYGIQDAVMFGKGFHAEFYLSEAELKRNHNEGYRFLMNKKLFSFLLIEIKTASRELNERMKVLLTIDLKKLSDDELFELYDFYGFKLGNLFVCYSMTQPHKVTKLERELVQYLKEKKIEAVEQAVSILTTTKTKFIFTKKMGDLFNSFSETVKREEAKIDRSVFIQKIFSEKKQNQHERNDLIKKLRPSQKIEYLSEVLRVLSEERLRMRFVWMKALYYHELFLIEFKRRFNVPKRDLRRYDSFELGELIKQGKRLSTQELKIREAGFVKIIRNSKIKTLVGPDAISFIERIRQKPKGVRLLEGAVACKGYAVGRAVLFSYRQAQNHSTKIEKMHQGDIVVTEMTRPNIIPACEKAGAIVTDEGGILCHAAIVSREMGVPCVIGTKEATACFKDGDYLEVNANKGRVRKITFKEYSERKHNQVLRIIEEKEIKQDVALNKVKLGNIFWFSQINLKDIPTVGGKGASLGELSKIVSVPNGFCVSVNAYQQFITENSLLPKINSLLTNFSITNHKELDERANQIRSLIMSKDLSLTIKNQILDSYRKLQNKKVAVRSSATAEDLPTASFAGQQDTFLNISTEKEVINSIKKCWASLFTSRAIYYREKNGFNHLKVLISVVVQEMADAKYAGVMFTKDPVEKKYVLIEVVKGLGEKLVSGEVTPNTYHLEKSSFAVLKKKESFNFNTHFLKDLGRIGRLIESHYKYPQDIEWAIDKSGKILILQSRAITTL